MDGKQLLSEALGQVGSMERHVIDRINGVDVIHVKATWPGKQPTNRYTVTVGPVTQVFEHAVAAHMAAQRAGED